MKPQILLIDDEESTLAALERVLRKDFDILKFKLPDEALSWLRTNFTEQIKIAVSDYRMPKMNGLDLLRELQITYPTIVRSMISGQIEIEELSTAINENLLHRFFLKPWDNDLFRLQILECLQLQSLLTKKDELEKLVITDPVTMLTNHRHFQSQIRIELERAKRHGRKLSLIMIDIDHFKRINDTLGHPRGDIILKQVAELLSKSIRNIDSVSRYGGEEFAMILPDTPIDLALEVAERTRNNVSSFFSNQENAPNLTISLGVSEFPFKSQTVQELISTADLALYQAKQSGRNRTVIA